MNSIPEHTRIWCYNITRLVTVFLLYHFQVCPSIAMPLYATIVTQGKGLFHTSLQWYHNEHDGVSITCVSIVCLIVCSGPDQRKHQGSASLVFGRGIQRWPVLPLTKGQQRGKCFHLMTSSCDSFIFIYTYNNERSAGDTISLQDG